MYICNPPDGSYSDDRSLLIAGGDAGCMRRLTHDMQVRGFEVCAVDSVCEAVAAIARCAPAFTIVDLRPGKPCGLEVVAELASRRPTARAVVLTAYDSFTTAVMAIKLGAADYLPRPVDPDQLYRALMTLPPPTKPPNADVMSVKRVRWEHVHRVYELCDRNVSETARRMSMHRRTLQRMLTKHAPR